MSLRRPSATYALTTPMAMANSEMRIVRGVTVKSPSLLEARGALVAAMVPPDHPFERLDQRRTVGAQLRQVAHSELFQLRFTARRQVNEHLPAVPGRARA